MAEEKKNEVTPFQFNIDQYENTKDIYLGILEILGVENPEQYLEGEIAKIPESERHGTMFNNIIANLFNSHEERRQAAKEALGKTNENTSPFIIAYLAEMSDKFIPFDTVLTAGKMVADGKSLQMGCGEGKTGVLSIAAYAKVQAGSQVFLTSSTPILAKEALDKLVFYDIVGIAKDVALITPTGIVRGRFDENGKIITDKKGNPVLDEVKESFEGKSEEEIKEMLAKAYESSIVASDNVTLMQHAMKGYLPRPKNGIKRELLADEADFVLLDSYRPLQRTEDLTPDEQKTIVEQRKIAYEILKSLKGTKGLYVIDDANQYVDFTHSGRREIVEEIKKRFANQPDVDKNKIFDYVYDALVVETVYKENRDYQILNGGKKIVSEDRASGVGIDLPEGIKQALEIKLTMEGRYTGEISKEKRVLDTLNVQNFFSEFFSGRQHFVSGTLGIDSDEIAEELEANFHVSKLQGDIYEIPPKGKGIRVDRGKTMFSNQEEKHAAIIDSAIEELGEHRPVLIGAVSEEEIHKLRKVLESRSKTYRILEYTAASEEIFATDKASLSEEEFKAKYGVEKDYYKKFSDFIKIEAGKEDTITIGTSIIGRGTTIKTDDKINESGGIHVIIDGLHETSSRNQEQYKARTARGTNAGSTIEFFSLEDIPEEYREDFASGLDGLNAEDVYKGVYKKIDARTKQVRQYVVEFVKITREHLAQVEEMELPETAEKEIKALITARAFSIRNRAVRSFRRNEYG